MAPFSEEHLVTYFSKEHIPKDAMIQLNRLLFTKLKDYCDICQEDRMICVLSPQCPKRILLKVRIQAGGVREDLPAFCYAQAINNIKRYLAKNTTLYTPQDELVFLQDFIDILFPNMYKKMTEFIRTDPKKIHAAIAQTKIPALNMDLRYGDRQMFMKLIKKDKVIRDNTFLYDISGMLLIVWYENAIFVANFASNIAIINAKEDLISNLHIIENVFHLYCAEVNLNGKTILSSDNQISLMLTLPFDQIKEAKMQPNAIYFQEFIEYLQKYFFQIQFSFDAQNDLLLTLLYQNMEHFLQRNQLFSLNYHTIHQIVQKFDGLRK